MSVAPYLETIVANLVADVVPVVEGHDRARYAVNATIDILSYLVSVSEPAPGDPAMLRAAAAALNLPVPDAAQGGGIVEDPHAYLGGESFICNAAKAAAEPAGQAISGQLNAVAGWEFAGLDRLGERWRALRHPELHQDDGLLQIDRNRLQTYLGERYPGATISRFRQLAGGRSKQTAIFDLVGDTGLPKSLVIRRDHPIGITDSSVADEFPLLERLYDQGIKVPQPHLLERLPDPLGGAFILSSALSGQSAGELFEPRHSVALALSLAETVGRVHAQPIKAYTGLSRRLTNVTERDYGQQLNEYEESWRRWGGPPSPSIEIAFKWLGANLHLANGQQSLVHGDVGFHNVLADGDSFLALLDWEFATIGNPAIDLGYVRPIVEPMLDWQDWLAAYRAAGGPDVPGAETDFHEILGGVRLATLNAYARHLVKQNSLRDLGFSLCLIDLNHVLRRISRGLMRVLDRR